MRPQRVASISENHNYDAGTPGGVRDPAELPFFRRALRHQEETVASFSP
jgi:hypothetical protein